MNQSKSKSEIDKDPHFWSSLFQRIGEGESLRKIAKDSKIPKSTLWAWIRNDPQLALRYSEAQQSRAIYYAVDLNWIFFSGPTKPFHHRRVYCHPLHIPDGLVNH